MEAPQLDFNRKYTQEEYEELRKFYPKLRLTVKNKVNLTSVSEFREKQQTNGNINKALVKRRALAERNRLLELNELSREIEELSRSNKKYKPEDNDSDSDVEIIISERKKTTKKQPVVRRAKKIESDSEQESESEEEEPIKPKPKAKRQVKKVVSEPIEIPQQEIQKPNPSDEIRLRMLEKIMQR